MPRSSGDKSKRKDIEFDMVFPSIPSPSPSVFAAVGETSLRTLVRCHHEWLRNSSIGHLFPADPSRFAAIVERIATFVVETASGSTGYAQSHGLTWFRTRHLPLTIDETARNVWLAAMLVAFEDVGFPDEARLEFWNWVEALSIRAITRRTMIGQPRRYPLAEAPAALSAFMASLRATTASPRLPRSLT
jgi:hemoglobin